MEDGNIRDHAVKRSLRTYKAVDISGGEGEESVVTCQEVMERSCRTRNLPDEQWVRHSSDTRIIISTEGMGW